MDEIISETSLSSPTIRKYAGEHIKLIRKKTTKHCDICEQPFTLRYPGSNKFKHHKNVCSYDCYLEAGVKEARLQYPDNTIYTECKECGYRAQEIGMHVNMVHKMNVEQYRAKHNTGFTCEAISQIKSERMTGNTNPFANHNGKYSPFSNNSVVHSAEHRKEIRAKAEQTAKENPQNRTSHIAYWLELTGGDEEEAWELYSERQRTFTLEKCIERYGEEEGTRRWKERQQKWLKTLNSKSPEEIAEINRKKISSSGAVSALEREIVKKLSETFKIDHQFVIFDEELKFNQRKYIYDIKYGNKIVEVHGDYWHMNPSIFEPEYFNKRSQRTAAEQWQRDDNKRIIAEESGYEVMVIWLSDYKNNKEETISKCINFLTQ